MFFMAETGRPSSHVKYIGRISKVWEETLMSTLYYLLHTSTPTSSDMSIIFFGSITRKAISGRYSQHSDYKGIISMCAFPGYVTMFTLSHTEANFGQDQRNSSDDLGNRDLSVNTAETKRCQRRMTLSWKDSSLHLCSGSDDISMFALACGGLTLPASFLA